MDFWANFWNTIWWFLWAFAFIAYLYVLFAVITDLFRDHRLNGWLKAVWILFLVFVPFLTVLIYLIARGNSMAERSTREARDFQKSTDTYIRSVAGSSPSEEISKAKALLDQGAISASEFEALKSRALG